MQAIADSKCVKSSMQTTKHIIPIYNIIKCACDCSEKWMSSAYSIYFIQNICTFIWTNFVLSQSLLAFAVQIKMISLLADVKANPKWKQMWFLVELRTLPGPMSLKIQNYSHLRVSLNVFGSMSWAWLRNYARSSNFGW